MQTETGLSFKFGFVKNNASIARKKGMATETMLDLDGTFVPYEDIVETASLDDRLVLVLAPKVEIGNQTFQVDAEDSNIVIQVSQVKALDLKTNQCLAHLNGSDAAGGAQILADALRAYSNYVPALRLVQRLRQASTTG